MLLKSIRLQNIRSYVDETVEFPTGSVLLAGEIGSGKSTVLLGIEFAFFGIQRGELSGTDLLRHGAANGSVELCFDLNGKIVVIGRSLKRDKKGVSQDTGFFEIDGQRGYKTASELRAFAIALLGYPQEYMTKNPLIFRYTLYTPQDDMKRILFADMSERLNILRKLFDVDKYGRIRDNTSNVLIKELRAMKRGYEIQFSDIEQKLKEKADKETTLLDTSRILQDEKHKLLLHEGEIKHKEQDLEDTSSRLKELNKVMQSVASNKAMLDQKKRRLQAVNLEMAEADKSIVSLQVILDKQINRPESDDRELSEAKMRFDKQKQEAVMQRGVLDNEIRRLKQTALRGVCEFCGQGVADPSSFKSKIDEKTLLLNQKLEVISNAGKEIERLDMLRKAYTEYLYELRIRTDKQKDHADAVKRREMLNEELTMLVNDIEGIERIVQNLTTDVSLISALETKERKLKMDLMALRRTKDELSRNVTRTESQLDSLQREIESIEKQVDEKQILKQRHAKIAELMSWFELVFIPLMETMEKSVMSTIQEEFSQFFQQWFSVLIPDENISVKIDEQFSPIIEQAGYQTEYQNLSGGEKTSVALAYRLALNKVINSLVDTIKTKDLIILDEPTDGFSMDQLDRLRDVLGELALKQMIIVSHEPKVDTYVDNIIRFYKEGHISRVVRD